jgi:signal transduction histidine kinase
VREGLQRLITLLFYGRRAEPAAAAALIGRGLDQVDGLDQVLETARSALRLPSLAVTDVDDVPIARTGPVAEPDWPRSSIPLRSRDQLLGRLEVALRAGESRLHRADADALALLVGPLALLLRERALGQALRDSRAQVVQARESERSVLHRDLHDGLGPTLTNAAFRADAAANRLATDPVAAAGLLAEARVGVRDARSEVRRVGDGRRPLALEESFGLQPLFT